MNSGSAPERREIALALVFRDGRILIARRLPGAHLAGYWEFPGGKIQPGETAEAAAEREVREETGVRCRAVGRREAVDYDYPGRPVRLLPVDCEWLAGEPAPRGAAECRWASPAELAGLDFPPANTGLVADLSAGATPRPAGPS